MSVNGILNTPCIELGDTGELNIKGDPINMLVKFTIREKIFGKTRDRASIVMSIEATFKTMVAIAQALGCHVVDAAGKKIT
jgi:hypothetical protein